MKFSFDVGTDEKHKVDFERNWFSGKTTIACGGTPVQLKNPWALTTHFNLQFVNRYEFAIGRMEPHEVVIEHERPKYMGGFFPHDYRVIVDGTLVQKHHGY